MTTQLNRREVIGAAAGAALAASAYGVRAQTPTSAEIKEWTEVGKALGKSGMVQKGGVYRAGFPRTDLKVTVDGVALRPGFALGGWAAFMPMAKQGASSQTMVMGDLVLTEDEITPVMRKLVDGGIDITAVHNHLLRAKPATLYMHVYGQGDALKLAAALHAGLAESKTPFTPPPGTAQPNSLDMQGIDRVMGSKGQDAGGIYQFGIPRAKTVTMHGMALPPPMGTAIGINFQQTGQDAAAITGDFVLTANEVNPVIKAFKEGGIEVTALHSHMLDEQPRVFFMHFWAHDNALKLARGLRAALDKVDIQKEEAHAR